MSAQYPTLEEVEISHVLWMIRACKGKLEVSAARLGIDPSTLRRMILRYGLEERVNELRKIDYRTQS